MDLKLLKRNKLYEGRVFNVIVDDVEYPSGNTSVREVVEHPGGAVALAMFDDGRIILVRQERYPFGEFTLELPAGKRDADEDPMNCAQRELEEETGYRAQEWKKLAAIYTSPGFCSEVLHIYQATGLQLSPEGRRLEEGELTMTTMMTPLPDAVRMIERGEIVDSKTICGILLADRALRRTDGRQ
jgi:ADP-ribose pyrophosphatase